MTEAEALHMKLAKLRAEAHAGHFDDNHDHGFPSDQLRTGSDDPSSSTCWMQ